MQDLKNKPLKILVVEDTEIHQIAARKLLEGHDVTVVDAFDYALDVLGVNVGNQGIGKTYYKRRDIDVVLTDLFYTQGRGDMLKPECKDNLKVEQMPYGFPLALIAARRGIPTAVITDTNHHNHPMAYTFDYFVADDGNPHKFNIDGTSVVMTSNMPGVYLTKNGDLKNREELSEDQRFEKDENGERVYKYAKNWKAVLDELIGEVGK